MRDTQNMHGESYVAPGRDSDQHRPSLRKPPWLTKKIQYTEERHAVKSILNRLDLNTVCKSARCPNLSECYHHKRATFLILGRTCTRGCAFCSVEKSGESHPFPPDPREPERIIDAVKELGLRYVVITSVTRDDLPDGGASQFARTVSLLCRKGVKDEVLIPDFLGSIESLKTIVEACPEVLNHNVETVPRLYPEVRPGADYHRSVALLSGVKKLNPEIVTKSGLMLGLGETGEEVIEVMHDLREAGCNLLTVSQYLQPSPGHHSIVRFVSGRSSSDSADCPGSSSGSTMRRFGAIFSSVENSRLFHGTGSFDATPRACPCVRTPCAQIGPAGRSRCCS